jgi:hypothetical protein
LQLAFVACRRVCYQNDWWHSIECQHGQDSVV